MSPTPRSPSPDAPEPRRIILRGEVWTGADAATDYGSKPRPVLVMRADAHAALSSVTVVPLTSVDGSGEPLLRVRIAPSDALPLARESWAMVEKIGTFRAERLRDRIGRASDEEMAALGRLLALYLGLG